MKRIILLVLGLALAAAICGLGWNTWQSTRFFEQVGREATIKIGKRYNAERWTSPIPIKKIYTYTAKLEPKYEVIVESDQELREGETRTVRFLTRDLANDLRAYAKRPVVNNLRLRDEDDGTPVKIEDTALFDALVDKWMGPPADGVYIRPRARPEAAPDSKKATVPFLFTEAGDGTFSTLWKNSRVQEWILLGLAILGVQTLLFGAYDHHKDGLIKKQRSKLGHPSFKKIEPEKRPEPLKTVTYEAKPEEEIALTDAEKRARAAGLPTTNPTTTRKTSVADAILAAETVDNTPSLSLKRSTSKPKPANPPESAEPTAQPAADTNPTATPAPASANASDTSAADSSASASADAAATDRGPAAGTGGAPATPPASSPENEPASLAEHETAPPMPIASSDVVLKLRRKKPSLSPDSPASSTDGEANKE